MTVSADADTWERSQSWLTTDELGDDAILLRVRGGIAADRAEMLWSAIETALERTDGRRVVVDLTRVTGFDIGSIQELADTARASRRRHADLCAVLEPQSALDQYVRCTGLDHLLPLYRSFTAALPNVEALNPDDHAA